MSMGTMEVLLSYTNPKTESNNSNTENQVIRGEGTRAEFLARVANVEALCAELVRRNTAIEAPIPVVKIMMLFDGTFDWLKPSLK